MGVEGVLTGAVSWSLILRPLARVASTFNWEPRRYFLDTYTTQLQLSLHAFNFRCCLRVNSRPSYRSGISNSLSSWESITQVSHYEEPEGIP